MDKHTQESLDSLRLKSDVEAIAEGLGVSADGTRSEITARILASQEAAAETIPEDPPAAASAEDTPEDPERARDSEGQFSGDVKTTQPNEAYDPPTKRALSDKAKKAAAIHMKSYLGNDGFGDKVSTKVFTALEEGKQPCIVKGSGNSLFSLKVFSDVFDSADLTSDKVPGREGILFNVARALADANLYPTR